MGLVRNEWVPSVLLSCALLVLFGCAATDVQPRSEGADHKYDDQEERLLQATRNMRRSFNLYRPRHEESDRLEESFQRILDKMKISHPSGEAVKVRIVFESVPNAFALTTGDIYVTTAMLDLFESEVEIAFVLAHEYAHYELRHMLKGAIYRERAARASAWLGLLVASTVAAATGVYSDASATPAYAIGAAASSGYSRDLELEADKYALELMERSGYDASLARSIFEKLAQLGEPDDYGLLSSHPKWHERLDEFELLVAGYAGRRSSASILPVELRSAMFALSRMNEAEALFPAQEGYETSREPSDSLGRQRSFEEYMAVISITGCPVNLNPEPRIKSQEDWDRYALSNVLILFDAGDALQKEARYVEAASCYHGIFAYWGVNEEEYRAEAEYRVGVMLENGRGFSASKDRAMTFYRRAMMRGHEAATQKVMAI